MFFCKFLYIEAAPAETKGTMGKFDPNIGGVGMGFGGGPGVAAVLWPSDGPCLGGGDGPWCFGALVLCFSLFGGWPDHSGLVTP